MIPKCKCKSMNTIFFLCMFTYGEKSLYREKY